MWKAEIVQQENGRDCLSISLTMDALTLEIARDFCDGVYTILKDSVIDCDLRDVNRLVDLMTDLHQIIQEESRKERTE